MYDIRQFKPALYALLLLGFTGFAMAAENPLIWVIGVAGVLLHLQFTRSGGFRPLPRLVANLITIAAAGWMVLRIRQAVDVPILAIGEFLVLLQLIKLYEQRANRDIAQLLVLSLLLMVAAAISKPSLLFGLLLVGYLCLSLYCCLLFHLKVETDHARLTSGPYPQPVDPAMVRHDQRQLSRSMRRLTAFASLAAVFMAVVVFLLFPRGTGAGLVGNVDFKPSQAMTGFSDTVSFQSVARIQQNTTPVANVRITQDGKPWGAAGQEILLRGNAPDFYVSDPASPDRWKWLRGNRDDTDLLAASDDNTQVFSEPDDDQPVFKQEIRLQPTGTDVLFGMPGLVRLTPGREMRFRYSPADQVLQSLDPLTQEIRYTVFSTNGPIPVAGEAKRVNYKLYNPAMVLPRRLRADADALKIDPRIRDFVMQDAVCGTDDNGNLAQQRLDTDKPSALDAKIAENIIHYFNEHFAYTLDLTDARKLNDTDPLVQFLYDFKKGHCEYFAGAMALMCQSIGMEARMVVGFKCDEFNSVGGYYLVRQSHAHAWCEIVTPAGWTTFDPTVGRLADGAPQTSAWWQNVRHFIDYLQFTWGDNVVNYDAESRTSVIQSVDDGMANAAVQSSDWIARVRRWFNEANFYFISSGLISLLIWMMGVGLVVAVGRFLYEKWRLRQIARRIGLTELPPEDKLRLARQLGFYDELLRSLERQNIARPPNMTPLEFGRSIDFLPGKTYDTVQRLTAIYYQIRYGNAGLSGGLRRRLDRVVESLDRDLSAARPGG